MNNKYPEFEKMEVRDTSLKCGFAKGLLKNDTGKSFLRNLGYKSNGRKFFVSS